MPPGPVVGIDVAKAELVVAVRPGGDRWTVPNIEAGVARLRARLQQLVPGVGPIVSRTVLGEFPVTTARPKAPQVHGMSSVFMRLAA